MKTFIHLAALLVVAGPGMAEMPSIPPARVWAAPTPQTAVLPNGATLWVLPSAGVPLMHLAIAVNAGSMADPEGKAGLASLTASVLEEGGSGTKTPAQVVDAFDALGTQLQVRVRADGVTLTAPVISSKSEQLVPLVFEVLTAPRFEQAAFESLKARRLAQIAADNDDPRQVASTEALSAVFGKSPRGHRASGTLASVKQLTLHDVKAFYAANYRPAKVTVVAVGDVTLDSAKKLISAAMPNAWGAGAAKPDSSRDAVRAPHWVAVDKPGASQTFIALIRPGVAARDAMVPALEEVSVVLGGSFTSRLVQRLREKSGFTYGIGSLVEAGREGGTLQVRTSVRTDVTAPALEQIFEEMKGLASVTPVELVKARALFAEHLSSAFSSGAGSASAFAGLALDGLPANEFTELSTKKLASVTHEQAIAAAQSFEPGGFTVALVGDRAVIEKELKRAFPAQTITWKAPEP